MPAHPNRLYKREKLCSTSALDRLFSSGRSAPDAAPVASAIAYPWRAVWAEPLPSRADTSGERGPRFVIAVPKKRLRKAVDRVTMRRRGREAYRLQRALLSAPLPALDIAFIYVASELTPYARSASSILRLLRKIAGNK